MGKKNITPQIPNKDNFSRISYLYNLSNALTTIDPNLSRGYNRNLDLISKKTVSKISPSLKRTVCKRCHTLLIPGLTMSMRIENLSRKQNPQNDVFVTKCLQCSKLKRYPIGKDLNYIPFHERVNEDTDMS
ncbi:uncharacterized protein KGF55_003539 [Candida pseudojiufengensis]|uniref:uncharacterized protein n=1 Tax=Candida pseudojiufengensis TaxID=497109 RepID=UPI002224A646|nr:uncharacterized protein KGF55_003539 [Candida pseudojiufengensis]KAI5962463.1 hypothetical protein KGF55_003539 [Candida pseudojiufengensis]